MRVEDPVRHAIAELVSAWNRCDARTFGELFTEDAEYVGADGVPRLGRDAIEKLVQQAKRQEQVRIEEFVSIRVDSDRAEVQFRWRTESDNPSRRGVIHCLMIQQPFGWRIDALHNHAEP